MTDATTPRQLMPCFEMADPAEYESVADGNYILCFHKSVLDFPLMLFDTATSKQEYFKLSAQKCMPNESKVMSSSVLLVGKFVHIFKAVYCGPSVALNQLWHYYSSNNNLLAEKVEVSFPVFPDATPCFANGKLYLFGGRHTLLGKMEPMATIYCRYKTCLAKPDVKHQNPKTNKAAMQVARIKPQVKVMSDCIIVGLGTSIHGDPTSLVSSIEVLSFDCEPLSKIDFENNFMPGPSPKFAIFPGSNEILLMSHKNDQLEVRKVAQQPEQPTVAKLRAEELV
jgi:hypothetical protein